MSSSNVFTFMFSNCLFLILVAVSHFGLHSSFEWMDPRSNFSSFCLQDVSCLLGLFLLPLARPSSPRSQLLLDHPPAQHGLHSTLDNEWLEFPGGFLGDPDCVMVPLVHPCCLLRGSSSQCHRLADTFLACSASPARLALRALPIQPIACPMHSGEYLSF